MKQIRTNKTISPSQKHNKLTYTEQMIENKKKLIAVKTKHGKTVFKKGKNAQHTNISSRIYDRSFNDLLLYSL